MEEAKNSLLKSKAVDNLGILYEDGGEKLKSQTVLYNRLNINTVFKNCISCLLSYGFILKSR